MLILLRNHAVTSRVAFFVLSTTRAKSPRCTVNYFSVSSSTSSAASAEVLDNLTTGRAIPAASETATSKAADTYNIVTPTAPKLVVLPESKWRAAAHQHSHRIEALLRPGLLPSSSQPSSSPSSSLNWTPLDPNNPIYNFLIEYYGLKGTKGVRRLARWSPDPELLLATPPAAAASIESCNHDTDDSSFINNDEVIEAAMEASHGLGGILLLNATLDDLGSILHLRGSVPVPYYTNNTNMDAPKGERWRRKNRLHGVLYNPSVFYNDLRIASCETTTATDNENINNHHQDDDDRLRRTMASYQWYSSILSTTLNSEPVLHCHGLHEWAMLYHPIGSDPPPSAMYQPNLPKRVSQTIINEAVERAGIRCTHVDALRFFAPAALPLNRHVNVTRMDQLQLEQKGCVHAQMDLLKMALKLSSFVDSTLLGDVLEVALDARRLDVAASPYDASAYGLQAVPVETREGRKMYRRQQAELMNEAEPIRRRLLRAYEVFMELAFSIR
ncbi:hypothetical protein ACHAWU_008833 [Discostella pseudostelligera]|uniref:Uncharacterized protein n=1 Tax=Discostella pseudostelligera TaxID=259834 RepID=A0ABD3N1B8_9STRA